MRPPSGFAWRWARQSGQRSSCSRRNEPSFPKANIRCAIGSTPDFRTRSSRSEKPATILSTVSVTCVSRRGQGHALRS
ncbi:hypothetical protein ELH96_20610 [Rhizobium leguminosarum]|nr:hypothetical protein ELH96_20610 [Rhizobium leguminosarum]